MDEYGTAASIDGMLSVMIIVTGLSFMFAMPGLIGFSADMQQGFQITAKSIQAMDIGKAIIFSEEGQKATFAYAKEPPPDDGKTKPQGRYENKTTEEWLGELGVNLSSNDFDIYMKTEDMSKFTPVMEVHTDLNDIQNANDPIKFLEEWIRKTVYNLMYDYFVGGERLHGRFNTQITTDYVELNFPFEKKNGILSGHLAKTQDQNYPYNNMKYEKQNSFFHTGTSLKNHSIRRIHGTCASGYWQAVV